MNVFELVARLGLDDSEYKKGLKNSEKGLRGLAKKLGSTFKTAGKAVGIAVGAAATGITVLTKAAVDSYADYEQLVGGVETLFGAGGKSLEEYAKNATSSMHKLGDSGEDIKKLQKELIAQGYDLGKAGADGIFGPKTQAAFEEYQKATGNAMDSTAAAYNRLMDAQNKVIENADNAYKTAGLSANQYMETVTSFSASLIQSLGGDTLKAADYADRAIVDMADNANKMGTNIESIQNAYQGFAKQNYTMLDNLKLGYGGTKEEMARLIKDASQMTDVQKQLGITVDESSMSFSNVVDAISVMQASMGIAGTTAEEAEGTISGSLGMMKSSWDNLIVAIASGSGDFSKQMDALVGSAETAFNNILPVVLNFLTGFSEMIGRVGPIIVEKLPQIISEVVPKLLDAAVSIVGTLVDALPGIMQALVTVAASVVDSISAALNARWPVLGEAFDWIINFVKTIFAGNWLEAWQSVVALVESIDWAGLGASIFNWIKTAFDNIGTTFTNIFTAARDAISSIDWAGIGTTIYNAIKTFLDENAPGLSGPFENAVTAITTALGNIKTYWDETLSPALQAAWKWLNTTFAGVFKTIADAINGDAEAMAKVNSVFEIALPIIGGVAAAIAVYNIAMGAAKTVTIALEAAQALLNGTMALNPIGAVIALIAGLVVAFKLAWDNSEKFREIVTKAWEAIKTTAETVFNAVKDFITNAWNFIVANGTVIWTNFRNWLSQTWDNVSNAVSEAWNAIKEFFSETFSGIYANAVAIWTNVANWLSTTWVNISNAINTAWDAIMAYFSDTFNQIYANAVAIWTIVTNWLSQTWDNIKNAIETAWNNIKTYFENTYNAIYANIVVIWTNVKNWFATTWDAIKKKVEEIWEAITTFLSETFSALYAKVVAVWTSIKNWFSSTWDEIKNKIEEIWNAITDFFTDTFNLIYAKAVAIWTNVKNWFSNTWNSIKNKVEEIWNAITDFLQETFGRIYSKVVVTWTNITNWLNTTWNNITTAITDAWNAISAFFSDIFSGIYAKIVVACANIKNWLSNTWESIKTTAETWWENIKSAITGPIDGIKSAVDGAITKIKEFLGFDGKSTSVSTNYTENRYVNTHYSSTGDVHGSGGRGFAKAMHNPFLLDREMIFGMNGDTPLVGGEAGHEVIMGEDYMRNMVQVAVNRAVGTIVEPMISVLNEIADKIPTGQLVLDTGALVGGIAGAMNGELNTIAEWEGAGHA